MNDTAAASKRMRREMTDPTADDSMDTDRLAADSLGYAKEALSILQELSNRRHHLSGLTKPAAPAPPQQDVRQTPRKLAGSRPSLNTPRNQATPRDKPFAYSMSSDSHLRSYGNPLFDLLNASNSPPPSPIPDAPPATPTPHDAPDAYPPPAASPASSRKASSLMRSRDMSTKASRLRAQSARHSADGLAAAAGASAATASPALRASERLTVPRHAAVLAELEAAKQREACLAQQLSRAHAEVQELKGQLDHQRALSKELAAAGRAAREALGKMADQNARLVTAYIAAKQQLHAMQGKHHPTPHEPYSDTSTDDARPHTDDSEADTEDEGQADSDDSSTSHSHSHSHSHHSAHHPHPHTHHPHPFFHHHHHHHHHAPHHTASPFTTPRGPPSPRPFNHHVHHDAATPPVATRPCVAPFTTPAAAATYPTPPGMGAYASPDSRLLPDQGMPQFMRPTEGLESHPCKGLDTESDTAVEAEAFTGLSSMSISDGASVAAAEEEAHATAAAAAEAEDLLAAAAGAVDGAAGYVSPRSRELAAARRQARELQQQNEQLLLAQQEAERLRQQMERMQEAERLKQEGNRAYARQQHAEAIAAYTRALSLEPLTPALRAILHCNRAAALHSTGAYADAISDCFQALHLDPSYARPLQRRADAYCALGDYAAAAADLRQACDDQPTNKELLQRLWDLQHKARTAPLVNHYAVLGVASTASLADVKSAYRKLALKYHPDKASNDGEQAAAAVLFRLVSTAHATLTSFDKRKAFDAARLRRKLRRSTFQV